MGVAGVALGTIISQTFSWLFGLFYINRKYPQIAIHPFCFRFDRALFRQVLGIGLPAGLQMSLVSLGIMAVMSKVDTFGKAYTAAYTVGNKLDSMAFLTVQALTNSITAFVGQNTGAKKPERVRIGVRIAVTATVVWCLFMIMSLTRDVTIFPKAAPMITPMAMSMTLPFIANSLNSLKNILMTVRIKIVYNILTMFSPSRMGRMKLSTRGSAATMKRRDVSVSILSYSL